MGKRRALVGAEKRLAMVAEDLMKHFEARAAALDGKAMIVCSFELICQRLGKPLNCGKSHAVTKTYDSN